MTSVLERVSENSNFKRETYVYFCSASVILLLMRTAMKMFASEMGKAGRFIMVLIKKFTVDQCLLS